MVRAAAVEVQPIDRLEEKVRQMVAMIDALRAEKSRAAEEAARLQQEVGSLKARLADGANAAVELSTLRDERDLIRDRVSQMISQIDKLNL
jgi:regulator of replication initiation timing